MFETAPAPSSPPQPADPSPDPGAVPTATTPTTSTVAEQTVDIHAPADMIPPASLRERLAWYAGALVLTCLLVFFGLRLDRVDLRAPFYYDLDALLILPMVKATAERGPGGHWRTNAWAGRHRRPTARIMDLYDYPVIDLLHFTLIWLLSKFVSHIVVLFQPVLPADLPADDAHGDDRLPAPGADASGRGRRRVTLLLPAVSLPALGEPLLPRRVLDGAAVAVARIRHLPRGFPFFNSQTEAINDRPRRGRSVIGLVLLCVAVASAGAYYAFFACALHGVRGTLLVGGLPDWRALAAAGCVVGIIFIVGLIHHLPSIVTSGEYAKNPITDRQPEEADTYGMKIAHLILPIPDHNLSVLANLRVRYLSPNRPCEGENAGSLGIVGTAGLLGLLTVMLLPYRRGWPYGPLAALTLFALLLATIGGFGRSSIWS